MTQNEMVLKYMLDYGGITALDAMTDIGCMRLASRISELRQKGYPIGRQMVKVRNRRGEDCYIAEYRLEAQ